MKAKHLLLLVAATMPLPIFAAIGDTFTARSEEGVLVTYYVTSETKMEVEVGNGKGSKTAVDKEQKGSITIPEEVNGYRVSAIGKGAFNGCSKLTEIILPESIQRIGRLAFKDCSSLARMILPEGLEIIEDGAFRKANSLQEIIIPDNVTTIGEDCFRECSSLFSIELGEGIEAIPDFCFYKSPSLIYIEIPDNVVSIGKYAFSGCKGLQSIYISDGVESIFHYAFKDCIDLVDVVIGSSVKEIKMEAFKNCSNLETLVLGESIEDMGSFVVENCKRIKWIEARSEFPASIHKTTFYLGASSTKTYMDIFNNVPLYVPKGCKTRYENAPEWQHFKNIIERDEEDAIACVERNRMFDTFYSIDGKKAISSDKGIIVVQSKNKKSRKVIRK